MVFEMRSDILGGGSGYGKEAMDLRGRGRIDGMWGLIRCRRHENNLNFEVWRLRWEDGDANIRGRKPRR